MCGLKQESSFKTPLYEQLTFIQILPKNWIYMNLEPVLSLASIFLSCIDGNYVEVYNESIGASVNSQQNA